MKTRIKRWQDVLGVILALSCLQVGCASRCAAVRTITHEELVRIVKPSQGNSFPAQTYYCGSADGFDYVQVRVFASGSRDYSYRITQTASPIQGRFPLTSDQTQWLQYYPTLQRLRGELQWNALQRFQWELGYAPILTNGLWSRPFFGTNSLWESGTDIPPSTAAAMKNLHVGMTETDALAVMVPVALDWGRITWGGSGSGRLYFQVSPTQQIWLEMAPWKVVEIGAPEPKRKWTRRRGNEIQVEW